VFGESGNGRLLGRLRKSHHIPGWVDLQVNGHAGVSFCSRDLTLERVAEAMENLLSEGTYAFLATVVTSPAEVMTHCLSVLGAACESPALSRHLLGIHLEGPFLSPEAGARGAHPPEHLQLPDLDRFNRLQERAKGHIRVLTLAPELPGALRLVERISESEICSAGHTMADYATLKDAVQAGLRLSTHLGNGVPEKIHRHQNPIVAQLALPELAASLIADGFHLPESFIRAVLAAKEVGRCFIVSDQTFLAGMPPGEYLLGGVPVVLEANGFAHMRDEPYLAGSSRTMAECMEHLAGFGFLSDEELVRLGYETPLRILERLDLSTRPTETCLKA